MQWTFGQFVPVVRAMTRALYDAGIRTHDVVAIELPNNWEFVALTLATWNLGAVICPIIPIFREHEVREIVFKTRSKVLVVLETFRHFAFTGMVHNLTREYPDLRIWMRGGQRIPIA